MRPAHFAVALLPALTATGTNGSVSEAAFAFPTAADASLILPRAPALRATAVAGEQGPSAVEASLGLDQPTRRLIQRRLRNEGFDPGPPDGLFGPRTRAAIRAWQESLAQPQTGYLDGPQAATLGAAGASGASLDTSSPVATVTGTTLAAPGIDTMQEPAAPASAESLGAADAPREAGGALAAQTVAVPTVPAELPPAILLDSYLLRAEQSVRNGDDAGARTTMEQLVALQTAHELVPVAEYHYRYARVWNAVGAWDQALASVMRYLALTGRDGEHYLDALTVMNEATARVEEVERKRELRLAEEARRRAADERARAELERQLAPQVLISARVDSS